MAFSVLFDKAPERRRALSSDKRIYRLDPFEFASENRPETPGDFVDSRRNRSTTWRA
jgi:hypothetical protein